MPIGGNTATPLNGRWVGFGDVEGDERGLGFGGTGGGPDVNEVPVIGGS